MKDLKGQVSLSDIFRNNVRTDCLTSFSFPPTFVRFQSFPLFFLQLPAPLSRATDTLIEIPKAFFVSGAPF